MSEYDCAAADVLIHARPTLGTIPIARTTNLWDFWYHPYCYNHQFRGFLVPAKLGTATVSVPWIISPSFLFARKTSSLLRFWRGGRVSGWLISGLTGRCGPLKDKFLPYEGSMSGKSADRGSRREGVSWWCVGETGYSGIFFFHYCEVKSHGDRSWIAIRWGNMGSCTIRAFPCCMPLFVAHLSPLLMTAGISLYSRAHVLSHGSSSLS